eukprot:1150799-Pelagomonas_calceolata.AAC.8
MKHDMSSIRSCTQGQSQEQIGMLKSCLRSSAASQAHCAGGENLKVIASQGRCAGGENPKVIASQGRCAGGDTSAGIVDLDTCNWHRASSRPRGNAAKLPLLCFPKGTGNVAGDGCIPKVTASMHRRCAAKQASPASV